MTTMAVLPPLRFEDCFWTSSKGDYTTGIGVLHDKMDQSYRETEEVMAFLRERIACEEAYGNRLVDLGNRRLKLDGFLRDEGASLRRTFESVRHESVEFGKGHIVLAHNLQEMVLNPLQKFHTESRIVTQNSREGINIKMKQFDQHLYDLDRSHAAYVQKCNAADQAELDASKIAQEELAEAKAAAQGPNGVVGERRHEFASQRFTIQELNAFLTRMRREVPYQDVRVPIMGTYTGCCSGSALGHWIQQNTKARTVEEAEHIGQSLADEGFLRLIGQRGNRFLASPANFYQWRDQMFELLEEDQEEDLSLLNKAKQEREKADAAYHQAVKRADMTRLQLEVGLFVHMDLLQRFEYDRINTVKEAFLNFAAIFSNVISITQSVADNLMVFQEALRPKQDVQYIIEQYRTGAFVPMPTLYNNFYHGPGLDQVFGVNIDTHCKFSLKKVPLIVLKCLSRVRKSCAGLSNEQKLLCWTTDVPLADIHILRNRINTGAKISQKLLRLFDVATVIGVLRLYFLELPKCLMTVENYETVKVIYSSAIEDTESVRNDARIASIRNLLNLLSLARFYTLHEVIKAMNLLIKETDADDSYVSLLAYRWGSVLLRPDDETAVTMHDKHPQRMVRDLIKFTISIFEPIKMSKDEGALSRSTTTRMPAKGGIKRNSRFSRDMKNGGPADLGLVNAKLNGLSNGNGNVHGNGFAPPTGGVMSTVSEGVSGAATPAISEMGEADGSGVGPRPMTNVSKLQRRLGPQNRTLMRGVSSPEMFGQSPAFKKKPLVPAVNGTGEAAATNGSTNGASAAQNPSLLNTNGLQAPAGGEKSSRSPLSQSVVTEEAVEENAEGEAEAEAAEQEEAVEILPVDHQEAVESAPAVVVPDVVIESSLPAPSPSPTEGGLKKSERVRRSRLSAVSNGVDMDVNGVSAEALLQSLKEDPQA